MISFRDKNNNAINTLIQSDTIYIKNSSVNQQKDKKQMPFINHDEPQGSLKAIIYNMFSNTKSVG